MSFPPQKGVQKQSNGQEETDHDSSLGDDVYPGTVKEISNSHTCLTVLEVKKNTINN